MCHVGQGRVLEAPCGTEAEDVMMIENEEGEEKEDAEECPKKNILDESK